MRQAHGSLPGERGCWSLHDVLIDRPLLHLIGSRTAASRGRQRRRETLRHWTTNFSWNERIASQPERIRLLAFVARAFHINPIGFHFIERHHRGHPIFAGALTTSNFLAKLLRTLFDYADFEVLVGGVKIVPKSIKLFDAV